MERGDGSVGAEAGGFLHNGLVNAYYTCKAKNRSEMLNVVSQWWHPRDLLAGSGKLQIRQPSTPPHVVLDFIEDDDHGHGCNAQNMLRDSCPSFNPCSNDLVRCFTLT